ncbi:MAG: COX15/CtaA family protein, partial [Magnetococcales bacterium]|nr:COX15/CtaA family protein [Magnetococcales bacterium]
MSRCDQKWVGFWLFVCCAMVYAMLALGGITRLTGSGLSMVEWQPVAGILPPTTRNDWQELFARYQQSPEFQHINHDMDLEGFKNIFWLEFHHRLVGRVTGLVFLLPFLFFLLRRKLERPLVSRLAGMFLLGGLQGVMGWLMVKSGLVDDPHVSPYRLTAHLGLAFLLYGWMLWTAMELYIGAEGRPTGRAPEAMAPISLGVLTLISVTVISGGFMAGAKAGYGYNTFPLMAGQWFPDAYWEMQPAWRNFFENVATIQWDHRLLATLTLLAVVGYWDFGRRVEPPPRIRVALRWLLIAVIVQVVLGVATLLLLVPVQLAWAHQVWSMALFTIALFIHFHLQTGSGRAGWS